VSLCSFNLALPGFPPDIPIPSLPFKLPSLPTIPDLGFDLSFNLALPGFPPDIPIPSLPFKLPSLPSLTCPID